MKTELLNAFFPNNRQGNKGKMQSELQDFLVTIDKGLFTDDKDK